MREREYHFEVEPVNSEVKVARVAENEGDGRVCMNIKWKLKRKRERGMKRRVPGRSGLKRRRRSTNAVHGRGEEMLLHPALPFFYFSNCKNVFRIFFHFILRFFYLNFCT